MICYYTQFHLYNRTIKSSSTNSIKHSLGRYACTSLFSTTAYLCDVIELILQVHFLGTFIGIKYTGSKLVAGAILTQSSSHTSSFPSLATQVRLSLPMILLLILLLAARGVDEAVGELEVGVARHGVRAACGGCLGEAGYGLCLRQDKVVVMLQVALVERWVHWLARRQVIRIGEVVLILFLVLVDEDFVGRAMPVRRGRLVLRRVVLVSSCLPIIDNGIVVTLWIQIIVVWEHLRGKNYVIFFWNLFEILINGISIVGRIGAPWRRGSVRRVRQIHGLWI